MDAATTAVNKLMALNIDTEVIFNQDFLWSNRLQFVWVLPRSSASELYFAQGVSNCSSKVTWNRVDRQVEIQLSKLEYLLPLLNF